MNEQTRYRVTGAVFLISIAIVVLPMVFDGKGVKVTQLPEMSEPLPPVPTPADLDELEISAVEIEQHRAEQALTSGILDADGFNTTHGTRIGDPVLVPIPDASPEAVSAPDSAAPVVADTAPAGSVEKTTVAPARRAPPVVPGTSSSTLAKQPIWAVQLASFSSPINATALRDRLLNDGYEAWVSTAKSDSVVRTRVAIGPLLDRRDAERMRDLVSGRYSLQAIVVHMEP